MRSLKSGRRSFPDCSLRLETQPAGSRLSDDRAICDTSGSVERQKVSAAGTPRPLHQGFNAPLRGFRAPLRPY